jgi:phosphate transport system substrate-binding protein
MKKLLLITAISASLSASALDSFKDYNGTLRIAGGTAHIPVIKSVANEIKKVNANIKISIAGGGSGVGIKKVSKNLVDIGNAGRKASEQEIKDGNLKLFKWAIDGIAVVVNKENNITNLTKAQIKDIFSGKIKNWKSVGGADSKINIYTRDKASGTRKVFSKKILDKEAIAKSAIFVTSNGAMKRAVIEDKSAIGFMSAGFVDNSLKGVAIDGIAPTAKNIKDGKYKYVRGLYSITKGGPKGIKKAFIDYLFSKHVQQDIVAKKGFIPVK